MSIVAIARVKDEADIIAATVAHMLTQVDHVIVEDNASTDGTIEILEQLDVQLQHDPTVGYYQSAAMTRLAEQAAVDHHADVIVPFDADEIWYSPFGRVADVLAEHAHLVTIFTAELYDHVATAYDTPGPDPVARIGWRRRAAAALPKVAVAVRPGLTIHQGNHGASIAGTALSLDGLLVVRHFPYRCVDQFVGKVRNGAVAYAATDLPEDAGKHWRDYGRLLHAQGPGAIADVFHTYFWSAAPAEDDTLIFDPAPTGCPSPS